MQFMTRCRPPQTCAALFYCLLLCLIAITAPLAAESPAKTFHLTISRGILPADQRVLRVTQGNAVQLRLTSDAEGEIHLHGYRLEAKVAPGTPAQLGFKAHATGRYRIEFHRAGETGKTGDHHGPPLATLEVRPK